ncbi:MAG: lamin tail domain-containing protein, partial [Bacteroidales bacterium]|nr:lamin tail domain-containing protein [Bacteroidales bacterium]
SDLAIAMALFLYNEVHDEESNILTIERVSRIYSPWSSKYYNMRKPVR